MCLTELRSLVSSLGYLVSNERQVLLGGIRLGGSATLEEFQASVREKSLKQKIKEAEATLRHLNEEIESASHEFIQVDYLGSAAKTSEERTSQRSFISIVSSSPLSINLQLAQWPLGYKFNMLPTFDG